MVQVQLAMFPEFASEKFAPGYDRAPENKQWVLFPRDVEWRKSLYPAEAISHPAKMQLHIVKCCVEAYAQPGWTVLDPFAGTGTTALAAVMGYRTTLIELEDEFRDMLIKTRRDWIARGLIADRSWFNILTGDCRQVMKEMESESFNMVLTSPPYSVTAQVGKEVTQFTGVLAERKAQMRRYGSSESDYLNIGRLNPFDFNTQMGKVYGEIARLLKPGGLYISVTKDSMVAGVRRRLSSDVIRTVTKAGLEYTGDWFKWKAPGGLMQNVMVSKGAEVVKNEDIIVFSKGEA